MTAYHDTRKQKPSAEPILQGISKLGLLPNEVLSIGDEEKDIIATNKAGAISVLVAWGSRIDSNYKANYHCKSVDELKNLLIKD